MTSVNSEALRSWRAGGASTVDQMSEGSFPASDPPAVWTWETNTPAPDEASPKAAWFAELLDARGSNR